MAKTFYILDSFLLPTGYNHMFMVQKIGKGFEYQGFKVKIVSRVEQITEPGFVMISNQPVYFSLGARHNPGGNLFRIIPGAIQRLGRILPIIEDISIRMQFIAYKKLAAQVKGKDIAVITWDLIAPRTEFLEQLGVRVIFTGDYYDRRPPTIDQRRLYDLVNDKNAKNGMPLKFAAAVDPDKVGEGCKNNKYLISYVGDKSYGPEYRAVFADNPRCKIVPTPPYITEEEKINIYKNSMFVLGITGPHSERLGHVPERIFEALAFGAICLTDNISAVKITDGCAILIRDTSELRQTVDRLERDKKARYALRRKGFKFIAKEGNWAARAKDFIDMAKKAYGIDFS